MAIVKLVEFGRGGDTAHLAGGMICTGYGNPDRPHAGQGETIPDGTPVIDKRAAVDTTEGYTWVFKGPLVSVDMEDGEVERCPEPSAAMACGMSGEYLTHLALQTVSRNRGESRGPLDFVGVAEYVDGWRHHGARIGHYRAGRIVWEPQGLLPVAPIPEGFRGWADLGGSD